MTDFSAKTKALFECLDGASAEIRGTRLEQRNYNVHELLHDFDEQEQRSQQRRSQMNPFRGPPGDRGPPPRLSQLNGKKSIFKKPDLAISRCLRPKKQPDYVKNPHRWQRYTLMDVSDVTESSNSVAAFEVLRQLEERREAEEAQESAGDRLAAAPSEPGKIEFKKSSKIKRQLRQLAAQDDLDPELDAPKMKGNKFVMPEYVVGQASKKERTVRRVATHHEEDDDEEEEPEKVRVPVEGKAKKRAAGSRMKLAHLMEPEEADEDEEVGEE